MYRAWNTQNCRLAEGLSEIYRFGMVTQIMQTTELLQTSVNHNRL